MQLRHLLALALCSVLSLTSAAPIFYADFESTPLPFSQLIQDTHAPAAGKASALLAPSNPEKDQVAIAISHKLIPVKPNTWYRFSFFHKNTIKNGEVKYGFRESQTTDKLTSEFYAWKWCFLPLNMVEWQRCTGEFQTAKDTHALKLYIRTENQLNGESWWDDFTIEEFTPTTPAVEILPFDAVATFTDIPTRQAYTTPTHTGKANLVTLKAQYHWRDLDLTKATLPVKYNALPQDGKITASLYRGNTKVFTQTTHVSGTGTLQVNVNLPALPPGKYLFVAEARADNKLLWAATKELWRIRQEEIKVSKLEPIQTVTTGPNRQRLVNGKPFHMSTVSHSPTGGLLEHHQNLCKPDLPTYIKYMQEQFGINTLAVWTWRQEYDEAKEKAFIAETVEYWKKWCSFLGENNFYANAMFEIRNGKGKRQLSSDESYRALVTPLATHPALLEWSNDEPEIPNIPPERVKEVYDLIKTCSPNRLVDVNLCDPNRFAKYAPATDIASFDHYPFPAASLAENEKFTRIMLQAHPSAPFDSYLQGFNFLDLPMPTFDQLRGEFVLDRINGSQSLLCYAWGERRQCMLSDMELQAYYRVIYAMFAKICPVMDNGSQCDLPLHTTSNFVRHTAYNYQNEKILMVVNMSADTPAEVSVDTQANQAEDFYDAAWKYPIANGKLSLKLTPSQGLIIRLK